MKAQNLFLSSSSPLALRLLHFVSFSFTVIRRVRHSCPKIMQKVDRGIFSNIVIIPLKIIIGTFINKSPFDNLKKISVIQKLTDVKKFYIIWISLLISISCRTQ